MGHDTALIVAMVLCWGGALGGSAFIKHKTGSVFLAFITGIVCGAIGLGIAVAMFGIKQ